MTESVISYFVRYSSRLLACFTDSAWASPSGVSAGSRMPCARARSSIVAGRRHPSRWTCSSALGQLRSASLVRRGGPRRALTTTRKKAPPPPTGSPPPPRPPPPSVTWATPRPPRAASPRSSTPTAVPPLAPRDGRAGPAPRQRMLDRLLEHFAGQGEAHEPVLKRFDPVQVAVGREPGRDVGADAAIVDQGDVGLGDVALCVRDEPPEPVLGARSPQLRSESDHRSIGDHRDGCLAQAQRIHQGGVQTDAIRERRIDARPHLAARATSPAHPYEVHHRDPGPGRARLHDRNAVDDGIDERVGVAAYDQIHGA